MKKSAKSEPVTSWQEAELLAMVAWGSSSADHVTKAYAAIQQANGLRLLAVMGEYAVSCLPGFTALSAARVCASLELGKRTCSYTQRMRVSTSADVATWAMAKLGKLDHEELWILSLDSNNCVVGTRMAQSGSAHSVGGTLPALLRAALLEGGRSMILVHNHPGGNARPSKADVETTRIVRDAAKIIDVPLVDHVIIAPDGSFSSFLDLGLLEPEGQ